MTMETSDDAFMALPGVVAAPQPLSGESLPGVPLPEDSESAAVVGPPADADSAGDDLDTEMPEPPENVREAGRLVPDHWLGLVDPGWAGSETPPHWAVMGQWRSDADGEIVGWRDNPEYRPSPVMLGWPEPTDPVDTAMQLAATRYGPGEDLARALAGAEVAVLVHPDGSPVTASTPEGTPVVPVYTAQPHLSAAGRMAFEVLPADRLLERLPEGHQLYLNPGGPVPALVETEFLLAALADTGQPSGDVSDESMSASF
ncbi:type VII secretion system-associated protein [Streptomyces sp. NPDC005576]|uniref:type VII secretion system-associated protein n=1 Tax=unclassified Streptomyces TaxID=2593676 RepID=UPI00340BA255